MFRGILGVIIPHSQRTPMLTIMLCVLFLAETATPPKSPIQVGIDLDAAYPSENGDTSQPPPPTSAVDGVFIDDDFGLSLQQESENIRQQQMLIEKEISRIQEESRIYDQQQNQSLKVSSLKCDTFGYQ